LWERGIGQGLAGRVEDWMRGVFEVG
jgi:hypothetical protein